METKGISLFKEEIRLDILAQTLWRSRKKYIVPLAGTFVVSALLALSVPRYYTVQIMLAPEYNSSGMGMSSGLGGLAASVGLRLGGNTSTDDALIPMFYPDVIQSTEFLVPLLDVPVETKDKKYTGTYATYLLTQQKAPWWEMALGAVKSLLQSDPEAGGDGKQGIDPFRLSKPESDLVGGVGGSITCAVDKKTDVITLTTVAQDPLVAALFANAVKDHLQDYIIEYRTKKARMELANLDSLCTIVKNKYEKALQQAAVYSDSHQGLFLQSYRAEKEKLEAESQMIGTAYNVLIQQRQMAEAKVLERTPAFTTIQNATVPVRHSGPKRMFFVLTMLILAFLLRSAQIVLKESRIRA